MSGFVNFFGLLGSIFGRWGLKHMSGFMAFFTAARRAAGGFRAVELKKHIGFYGSFLAAFLLGRIFGPGLKRPPGPFINGAAPAESAGAFLSAPSQLPAADEGRMLSARV